MTGRCKGKNCKFTHGFDVPHVEGCPHAHEAPFKPDNSCGPNNINIIEHNNSDMHLLGSAEYMKILVLAMYVLDVEEIRITEKLIAECTERPGIICIESSEDGILLKLVTEEEAEAIAKAADKGAH